MAETCLDCFNKTFRTNHTEKEVVLSDCLDLCEDCGEWKRVVICEKSRHSLSSDSLAEMFTWLFKKIKRIFRRKHN